MGWLGRLIGIVLPLMCICQDKVQYLCDFENGDCGVTSEPHSGAYMALTEVRIQEKRTTGLALQELVRSENWTSGKPRTATIWTPSFSPVSSGLMTMSLDYFLVGRSCVDFVRFGQILDGDTIVLGQLTATGEWKTANATLVYTEEPLVLFLKVHLQPSCKQWKDCKCSGQAVIDNVRITGPTSEPALANHVTDTLEDFLSQLELDPTTSPLDPTISTTKQRDRLTDVTRPFDTSAEEQNTHERQEQVDQRPHPQYHGGKKGHRTPRPPCRIPSCPGPVVQVQYCPAPSTRVCSTVARPNHCQCEYIKECPVYNCPRVLPCEPPPPCPPVPPPKSGYPLATEDGHII